MSERAEHAGEEKNILYVASAVLYNPASSRCHGMGSRFIPRYTVHLLTPGLSYLPPSRSLSLSFSFSLHLSSDQLRFFFLPPHAVFFSLPPPCSRVSREIIFAPVITTYSRETRGVKMKSYACTWARCRCRLQRRSELHGEHAEIGPWMQSDRGNSLRQENWLLINWSVIL